MLSSVAAGAGVLSDKVFVAVALALVVRWSACKSSKPADSDEGLWRGCSLTLASLIVCQENLIVSVCLSSSRKKDPLKYSLLLLLLLLRPGNRRGSSVPSHHVYQRNSALNQVYFTSTAAFPILFADLRAFQKTKSRFLYDQQPPTMYVYARALLGKAISTTLLFLQQPSYFLP